MKIKFLPAVLILCLSAVSFGAAESREELARAAVSADAAASAAADKELRALGKEGLDALVQAYAAEIARFSPAGETGEDWKRIAFALASVAAQKDAYASRLFWHTDLEAAKKAARAQNKPILSLRLLGNLDGCLREHDAALNWARKAGLPEAEARALGGLGDAHYLSGRMRTAYDSFRRCVDLCRQHGLGQVEVANLPMVGWSGMYTDALDRALESAGAAADMARKGSHHRAESLACSLIGKAVLAVQARTGLWLSSSSLLVTLRRSSLVPMLFTHL